MRVSIIVPDRMVIVDGVARQVDVSGVELHTHAIQWDGSVGEIEYGKPINRNELFADFSPYQFLVDRWTAAAPPPPGPVVLPTKDEQLARTLADPVLAALVGELAARTGITEAEYVAAIKGRMR
jgi:hypothetical protein